MITFQKPHALYSCYMQSDTFGIRKQKLCTLEIMLTTKKKKKKKISLPGKTNIAHSLRTHWPIALSLKKTWFCREVPKNITEHKYHIYLNIRWELFPNLSSETWWSHLWPYTCSVCVFSWKLKAILYSDKCDIHTSTVL